MPRAALHEPGAWYSGQCVMALDGSGLEVADERANAEFFAMPSSLITRRWRKARARFPRHDCSRWWSAAPTPSPPPALRPTRTTSAGWLLTCMLRSKTPALVQQALWGLLLAHLAHFAIRRLMVEAA